MEFIKGFDLSTLQEVEQQGGRFFDGGKEGSALQILRSYGGNYLRLRLWNDPYSPQGEPYGAGGCDLPTVLALAHRAKTAGMDWLLDFHYSDFWADPGKQILPKAWADMTLPQLEKAVYQYTMDVLRACRTANVIPGMVQVGNEITNGLLWPHGKAPNFEGIFRLVDAGAKAVRDFDPDIPVMIHLDNGSNQELYRNWLDAYFTAGGICDIIGLSYYPLWHGTLQELADNLNMLAHRYRKPMVIVETSYYHTLTECNARKETKPAELPQKVLDNLMFPTDPSGQAEFLKAILDILDAVPEDLGAGFFWWEAAWIPVIGIDQQAGWEYAKEDVPGGCGWANQAMFDFDGNALPVLQAMRDHKR